MQSGYYTSNRIGSDSAAFYKENGYLVVVDGLKSDEVEELNRETIAICRGRRGSVVTKSFDESTDTPRDATGDPELSQLDDLGLLERFLCIHQAHKISPLIHGVLGHRSIVDVLTGVIGPNVKCMQSMLFIKAAGKPGQAWHQDEDFIPTRDRSLCGAWIALDDATVTNGCLWVIPGSHRPGVLWPLYPHNDERFDCASEAFGFPYGDEEAVPVEVPRGAIVFFNGYLLHRSLPNKASEGFRRVLVNHYMSAESLLPWQHREGIGMAKTDYRDVVMVAGNDPYSWKEYEDIAKPHIRPSGQGGCGDGRYELEQFKSEGMPVKKFL